MHKENMQTACSEMSDTRRNRENYCDDVSMNDQSKTGIMEFSCLNEIPFFHVTDSSGEDNTHIVDEGILHYNLLPSLNYFINETKYFTLQHLNERIRSFDYSQEERQNIPMSILKETFTKKKLKMTASEMSNFTNNLIFMIGDLVPGDDPVWEFVITTIKFYDLSYLPSYTEYDINEFASTIALMHGLYQQLFDKTLKPVHHIATHYPEDTRNFGPLRYLKTIRYNCKIIYYTIDLFRIRMYEQVLIMSLSN